MVRLAVKAARAEEAAARAENKETPPERDDASRGTGPLSLVYPGTLRGSRAVGVLLEDHAALAVDY